MTTTTNRIPASLRRRLKTTRRVSPDRKTPAAKAVSQNEDVYVNMGKPITAPCLIPVLHAATPKCINNPFMVNGEPYGVTALSFGSPHGAVFVDDLDSVDVASLGSALGTHALFPQGASIVFAQVIDKENVKARLWHRDHSGIVFTPEAATVAGTAAKMLQKVSSGEVTVKMNENSVKVQWNHGDDDAILAGKAGLFRTS
jgi:diaminopimelate epimerase